MGFGCDKCGKTPKEYSGLGDSCLKCRKKKMTHKQLREFRINLGLTITGMAQALNTPRGTYQKWERGERRVPGILDVAMKQVVRERGK